MDQYLPILKGKKVALVVNQTSMLGKMHLLDTLLKLKVKVTRLFGPEHGIRGNAGNGAVVASGKDPRTGLPVISLYGKKKKPSKKDLSGIGAVIFDIQDVGVRYYTYISTMHYVMEACADSGIPFIVLDRPNPNGFYIDGPVLDTAFRSFVGMHPIPLVHGMTVGELALMINGERWLKGGKKCKLTVVPMQGYDHHMRYTLPVAPSPNLPTQEAIYLYPSLGLLEGTSFSMGRGTEHPFECFGKPGFDQGDFYFTPNPIPGVSENPPYKGQSCRGFLVTDFGRYYIPTFRRIYIDWLCMLYREDKGRDTFFNSFFDKLAGTDRLRTQIIQGKTPDEIRADWEPQLNAFIEKRKPYLLYAWDPGRGLE